MKNDQDKRYRSFSRPGSLAGKEPPRPTRPITISRPGSSALVSQAQADPPTPVVASYGPPVKKRRFKKKICLLILVILLLLGAGVYWFTQRHNNTPSGQVSAPGNENSEGIPEQKTDRLRLIASGDMLPHDSVNQQAKTGDTYDYKPFFSEVKPFFDKADVRFCNQEVPSAGVAFGISGYPVFNAPEQFARDLSAAGCNVINLANNHINDKGQEAINKTLQVWDELKPLAVVGANRSAEEQAKVRYFETKGVKFAVMAYAETSNSKNLTAYGLNLLNESLIKTQLAEARGKADIVLVSVHWGTEYSPGINASQDKWASIFASNGADVVLGTGPHVLEPVKKLPRGGGGETLVWFSLGNMLHTQIEVESLIGGFAVMDIDLTSKKISKIAFLPTYMHYEWTVEQKAREDLSSRRNLKIYPLDKAADALAKSQNKTTVEAQTERVKSVLNSFTQVPIITSAEY